MKRKVLFVGEASYLSSGFALIHRELLKRLHERGNVEVAEFSSYAEVGDPRASALPWKIYCNAVPGNHPEYAKYQSRPDFQFGTWRFERVLLDYKPDIVFSLRDNWFDRFIFESVLRPFFHFINMPCHDSIPQQDEWLQDFIDADALFTYTKWAEECLKQSGGGKINLQGVIGSCADLNTNKPPLNKRQHKENFGIPSNTFLIGTVMRNQKRKLFPDLFNAFRLYLDKCNESGQTELAKRSYLYCHTSYPDQGFNIPQLLRDAGIASKVYFTYICQKCKNWFPILFQDARTTCHYCKQSTAVLPNVGNGLDPNQMVDVFKILDLYVQYSIAEGFGVPVIEAATCGVPVTVHNVTAMKDFPKSLEAYSVEPRSDFKEMETQAIRYYPTNEHLVDIIYKHFTESEEYRETKSRRTRYLAEKNYDWNEKTKLLEDYCLAAELTGLQGKWNAPPQPIIADFNVPPNCSNEEFIKWIFVKILNEPQKIHSYTALSWLRGLNYGATFTTGHQIDSCSREQLLNICKIKIENKIACEQARCGLINMPIPDYIAFANRER